MGLDLAAIQLLCCAEAIGVNFSNTFTIGRRRLHSDPGALLRNLFVMRISSKHVLGLQIRDYSEPPFRLLGVQQVCSLDASDYEQATYICDLNQYLRHQPIV